MEKLENYVTDQIKFNSNFLIRIFLSDLFNRINIYIGSSKFSFPVATGKKKKKRAEVETGVKSDRNACCSAESCFRKHRGTEIVLFLIYIL